MSSSFQATLDNLFWCEGNGAKFIHREHLCGEGKEGEVQSKAELGHLCLFPSFLSAAHWLAMWEGRTVEPL